MTDTDDTPDRDPEDDEYNYLEDGRWRCGRNDGCGQPAGWGTDHVGVGACKLHGGTGGAPEGNTNAVTVGAWSESFVSDFLRDDEIDRVDDLAELLGEPGTAQDAASYAAAIAMEQFRRTGDGRFLRRFEQLADKANLFPDDEAQDVNLNLEDLYRE